MVNFDLNPKFTKEAEGNIPEPMASDMPFSFKVQDHLCHVSVPILSL
jgi:hypothetical protein